MKISLRPKIAFALSGSCSRKLKNKSPTRGRVALAFVSAGQISIEEISLLTRQLATLTKAKIQLIEALSALVEIKQKMNP